jgi:hypothetical protein
VSWLTSDFSKQVTVMRMLSKSVQLHLSTYIPSSLPSCRSLLIAYSVLERKEGKERKLTPHSTSSLQDIHFPELPQVLQPHMLPAQNPKIFSDMSGEAQGALR